MTRAALRVDASRTIGSGHAMRCLTLAEALRARGLDCHFVSREHEGHLCDLIEAQGFALHRLPAAPGDGNEADEGSEHGQWLGVDWRQDADETLGAIGDFAPDWLIVDHYALGAGWEAALRPAAKRIMAIDDLADRPHDCDLLLDQNLVAGWEDRYRDKVPDACTLLLGPDYALLQPDYLRLRPRVELRHGPVRRVLVFFGGADRDNLTLRAIDALAGRRPIAADVVLSAAAPHFTEVARRAAGLPWLRLHDHLPSLAPLMLGADLAIGASGATSWERLCLGLPSLVVTVAENQRAISEELSRRGLVRHLGRGDEVDEAVIAATLDELMETGLDASWSKACMDAVDGRGVERVCAALAAGRDTSLQLRPAEPRDEALLLGWANDPATRRNAFNPRRISSEEHREWFRARLGEPAACALYIAEGEAGVPVGQVRFDRRQGEWEISYALAPAFRGRGLGRALLAAALQRFRETRPAAALVAQVKPENAASMKIFASLEFSVRSSGPDRYIYERRF